jgi:hypothetical protein
MSRPPHPPRLYNSNYTWRRVQILKTMTHLIKLSSAGQEHFKVISTELQAKKYSILERYTFPGNSQTSMHTAYLASNADCIDTASAHVILSRTLVLVSHRCLTTCKRRENLYEIILCKADNGAGCTGEPSPDADCRHRALAEIWCTTVRVVKVG